MTPPPTPPLILDFDASVLPLAPDERRIALHDWQERIRFGCSRAALRDLAEHLGAPPERGSRVFLGSGDYHHISALLLSRLGGAEAFDLVVCDNHPDNMRYPFGIHCGSWVSRAARLPRVRHIHVIGISSPDISLGHAFENRLRPFVAGKLTYWSVGVTATWLKALGLGGGQRHFGSAEALLEAFLPLLQNCGPLYLSLDKDVLSPEVVRTRWDQGRFSAAQLERLCRACAGKLIGADVCGEMSVYAYKSPFKRFLARLDGQAGRGPDAEELAREQARHQALNANILAWLEER